jgi:SAM-dependent methyltransferase
MTLQAKYDEFYQGSALAPKDRPLTGWPRDRFQAVVAVPTQGESILDIGCGDGELLYQFRQRFKRLVGLEYSPSRLEAAKVNLRDLNFVPVCGSAEAMTEIATGSIDCIITADVIEHIPDVYLAAGEMFRVLKPGGVLVINTPNIAFAIKRLRLLFGRFPSTSQPNEGLGSDVLFDGGHLHYFTYRSLSLLLQRSGLVIERRMGFGRLGKVHDLLPSLLSVGVQLVARKPA